MIRGGEAFMTQDAFKALPLKPSLLRALHEVFGYEHMSRPQALALPLALEGRDLLLRSSTGSGKTLTFLLAGLQRHLASARHAAGEVGVLILSPLREVALQTQREAEKLLTYLPSRGAQAVIGGTDIARERRRLAREPCDVLVATPGRLLDHLSELPDLLRRVHTVILDETDRMLDVGFAPAIRSIFKYLPPTEDRQALLVSATIDARVRAVAETLMRPSYVFLSTVTESSAAAATTPHQVNERIDLRLLQVDPSQILFSLERLLAQDPKKTLVFLPASHWASFTARLLQEAGHTQVAEFHGKLSQSQRTRTIARFTSDPRGVLIASDAAARGLDIQDIDRVIQVGLTDVAGFVQRSGRTARAGRRGEAVWILGRDESQILREFAAAKVPLQPHPGVGAGPSADMRRAVERVATTAELQRGAKRAFTGLLGAYAAPRKRLGWDAQAVVDAVKARFVTAGLPAAPAIEAKTLKKMNLTGVAL